MSAIRRAIPLLVYEDIEAAHDFLVGTFGFAAGSIERDGQGEVVHGEVTAGDVVIWLHRVSPEHEMASPRTMDAQSGGLVVHVDDVDTPVPPEQGSTASRRTRSTANVSTASVIPRATAGGSRPR
jgi:uncharacterized glyoxalase superfamily protein PhnB